MYKQMSLYMLHVKLRITYVQQYKFREKRRLHFCIAKTTWRSLLDDKRREKEIREREYGYCVYVITAVFRFKI